jgi:uncharacterized protein YkwD
VNRNRGGPLLIVLVSLAAGAIGVAPAHGGSFRDLLAPAGVCAGDQVIGAAPSVEQQTMLCLVNYARAEDGLAPLRLNAKLGAAARLKVALDIRFADFSHTPGGVPFRSVFDRSGYVAGRARWHVGENLAVGEDELGSPRATIAGWLESPEHRANVLDPTFRETGFGYRFGDFVGMAAASLWVNEFGVRTPTD